MPTLLLILAIIPGLADASRTSQIHRASERFIDQPAYIDSVISGQQVSLPASGERVHASAKGFAFGCAAGTGAIVIGLLSLFANRVPFWRERERLVEPVIRRLRMLQSGHVGDYVVWLVVGTVMLGLAAYVSWASSHGPLYIK